MAKLIAGKHFPTGGKKKFGGRYYYLKTVHKSKIGAGREKKMWKNKGKLVRVSKGSGGFPYHVFVR